MLRLFVFHASHRSFQWVLPLLVIILQGCATYRLQNQALHDSVDATQGYRLESTERDLGNTLVVLSFSGGGTRAAAFSYGALTTLRDTQVVRDGVAIRLLDEVDIISAVSGGSFTAAYYGLFGERIFRDYEDVFLKQSVQGALIRKVLNPAFWFRSLFRGLDRTEIAVEYYDTYIFRGKTFADIPQRQRPFIEINATDLSAGHRFSFTQRYFDLLCSDLNSFSVARAVTASSAVPILFPSVVLENYAGGCDLSTVPMWQALLQQQDDPATRTMTEYLRAYQTPGQRPFIHLVDGGISDNLGLRAITDRVALLGFGDSPDDPLPQFDTVAIILVNAETKPRRTIDDSVRKPGIATTLDAVSSAQIALYNQDTLTTLRRQVAAHNAVVREATGQDKYYFVEINFQSIASPALRDRFNALPTSLALSNSQVDELVTTGAQLLRDAPEYRALVERLQGPGD